MTTTILLGALALLFQEPMPAARPQVAELEIPFEILASRHMAVQVMVNGKGPYRVIFDTGAPMCLFTNRIAKEADLNKTKSSDGKDSRRLQPGAFPMLGMGGMLKADEVEIGNVKVAKMPVMVFDHPTVKALASVVGDIDGLIGFPFFARYRTTIDYQQKKMFLKPVDYEPGDVVVAMMKTMMAPKNKPPVKQLAARTLWGFDVAKDEGDEAEGVVIAKVWEGSPAAAAGLKVGDRLLVLDGVWTDSREDCWRAAAGVKPGRTVEAKIQRGGQQTRLSIQPHTGV